MNATTNLIQMAGLSKNISNQFVQFIKNITNFHNLGSQELALSAYNFQNICLGV
jgi:hypothetical protein